MIYALPGGSFLAVLEEAPAGLTGTLGVRVIEPSGVERLARTTVGINEQPPGSGIYNVTLAAPVDMGDYLVVWDADGVNAVEQLEVTGDLPRPPVPLGTPEWAPTVDDVAQVTPAYTRGGFDDDDELLPGGAVHGTFDDTTSPTEADVEGYIRAACDEIAGRVAVAIPVEHQGLARAAAKWHSAATIAAGKRPAGTDDATGEWNGHISSYRTCLDRLVYLCNNGPTRLA